jgi:hypothetical protein
MKQCECYIEDRQLADYTPLMKPIYKTVSLCFGTRERDRCSCGGDRTKCDFYPEVRAKANNEKPNTWVITENGCVITCPNCGERLELCYPDGTEVRYLPHCPWCGKKLEEK